MEPLEFWKPLGRLLMADGAIERTGDELDRLKCARALVVCGRSVRRSRLLQSALAAMGQRVAGIFDGAFEHPSPAVIEAGAAQARTTGADVLVAVGGGSTSDTAKGIAVLLAEGGPLEDHASRFIAPDQFFPKELHRPKLPILAIPTTASAAEVTPGLAIRSDCGEKLLLWDVKVASRTVVLDPVANVEVPSALMAATAMNALAHCLEGLYSRLRNPISEGLALQGIRLLVRGMPWMAKEPDNTEARAAVLLGAHLSGMVITNARVGIHHAVCHCLGARAGISHGAANSIVLPHALRYNAAVAGAQFRLAAEAMGLGQTGATDAAAVEGVIETVRTVQAASGVPVRLRDAGVPREILPSVAEDTLHDRSLYFNPRPTSSAEAVLEILEAAW